MTEVREKEMEIFIIYTVMMAMICIAVILTQGYRKEEFKILDKKIHMFKRFYGFSSYVFDLINRIHHFDLSNIKDKLGRIWLERSDYQKAYIYVISKITISFVAFFCIAVMGYIKCADDTFHQRKSVKTLTRYDFGKGDREYRLNVVFSNGKSEQVKIVLPEKKYSEHEIMEIFDDNYDKIVKKFLDKNVSTDNITDNLNLITNYNDMIDIQWNIEDNDYLDYTGNIQWSNITGEADLTVEMIFSMGGISKSYSIPITIHGEGQLKKDKIENEIDAFIQSYSVYDKNVVLPKRLNSESVQFEKGKNRATLGYIFFPLLVGILLFIVKSKELQKMLKKRNEELEQDYVFIISKIAILHSAGMNILSAWDKIIEDYNRNLSKNNVRYAYEEMKVTRQKIRTGMSEISAYVEFGRRCGLHSYMKLGNLLEQNVRKGTKGLKEMLNKEVNEAYENRKIQARKKGDEAGTKLLLPMGIMLVISMVMVIVPAFISINI